MIVFVANATEEEFLFDLVVALKTLLEFGSLKGFKPLGFKTGSLKALGLKSKGFKFLLLEAFRFTSLSFSCLSG